MRILIILLALVHAVAAWPRDVPGTRVSLDPPDGYVLAADFPGFVGTTVKSTIKIAELPAPFIELINAYDDVGLRRKGAIVRDRISFERDGLRCVLITADEPEARRPTVKMILLSGDSEQSFSVTATFFKSDESKVGAAVLRALQDVAWYAGRDVDHFGGLGFRLKEIPGLQVATRVSNSVIFTRQGRLPDEFYTGQMLIVGWSKGDTGTIKALEPFALSRFNSMKLLNNISVDNTAVINLAGADGIEVTGTGTHRSLGYDVAAFQVILEFPNRLLLAQGFANRDKREAAYDQFRTIMSTLTTDKPAPRP